MKKALTISALFFSFLLSAAVGNYICFVLDLIVLITFIICFA